MSDELKEIRDELREIRELLTAPAPRPDDLVDAHYIHQRTGLAVRTIRQGKGGTKAIPRVLLKTDERKKRPLVRYPRAAVDKWLRDLCRDAAENTPKARAFRLINKQRRTG